MVKKKYDGYIKYNEEDFIFTFEKNILNLFPSKDKEKDPLTSQIDAFLFNPSTNITLTGKTNCNRQIIFLKLNFHLRENGVLYSYVPAFIISKNNLSDIEIDDIKTIKFDGEIINKFYNPNIIIDKSKSSNLMQSDNMIVALKPQKEVTEKIKWNDINISISIGINNGADKNSLGIINSFLRLEFNDIINIDEIVKYYVIIKNFFKFLYFRNAIVFDNVLLGKKDEKGLYYYVGSLVVSDYIEDKEIQTKNNILYQEIKDYLPNILETVTSKNFYNLHFPNTQKDISYVKPDGFLLVASGFENIFRSAFPSFLSKKDKNYDDIKKETLEFLESKIKKYKGINRLKKKYVERFKYNIEKLDGNLEEKIKFCFMEYDSIITNLKLKIKKINNLEKVKDDEMIEKYVEKRNCLAHGNIDNSFSNEDIACHCIIKALIYLIILKKTNMKDTEISHILLKMFT